MRALVSVIIGGADVTARFLPLLEGIRVVDRDGQTSDVATITLDDSGGRVFMPAPGAPVVINLGWEGRGFGPVFSGVVDEVRATGGRAGRKLLVSAKGMDTRGPGKEPLRMHFDDTTIGDALRRAGQAVGFDVSVDSALSSLRRDYIALVDESFAAFGERLAREVGGTFKIVGDRAIIARRNGGESAGGRPLPSVSAVWGVNLHSYDIAPILGRDAEEAVAVRYYDRAAAVWRVIEAATGTRGARTVRVALNAAADEATAQAQAEADAAEADRKSGEGRVTIEGNIGAQPEGLCIVAGCRPGVDGAYRIEGVTHEYSRGGGFITDLELKQPQGGAGADGR
jgi:uncharacterized protein